MATKDPPSKAARIYAAAMAGLEGGVPSFGSYTMGPGGMRGLDRIPAAYRDPSAYPLPNPRNWLSQLQNVDPRTLPKNALNTLRNIAVSTAQDPGMVALPGAAVGVPVKAAMVARAANAAKQGATARLAELNTARTIKAAELNAARTVKKARDTTKRIEQTKKAMAMYEQAERFREHARSFPAGTKTRKALVRTSREWADATEAAVQQAGVTKHIPYKFTRTGPRSAVETPQPMRRKGDALPAQSRNFRGRTAPPASESQVMSGTTRVRRNTGEPKPRVTAVAAKLKDGTIVKAANHGELADEIFKVTGDKNVERRRGAVDGWMVGDEFVAADDLSARLTKQPGRWFSEEITGMEVKPGAVPGGKVGNKAPEAAGPMQFTRTGPRNFRSRTSPPASVSTPMSGTTRVRRNTGEPKLYTADNLSKNLHSFTTHPERKAIQEQFGKLAGGEHTVWKSGDDRVAIMNVELGGKRVDVPVYIDDINQEYSLMDVDEFKKVIEKEPRGIVQPMAKLKVPKAVHSELGLDDPDLVKQAYPSLKIDAKGNAVVNAEDLKRMRDDAATRADPGQGFETPAHRRNALAKWAAANKPGAASVATPEIAHARIQLAKAKKIYDELNVPGQPHHLVEAAEDDLIQWTNKLSALTEKAK